MRKSAEELFKVEWLCKVAKKAAAAKSKAMQCVCPNHLTEKRSHFSLHQLVRAHQLLLHKGCVSAPVVRC